MLTRPHYREKVQLGGRRGAQIAKLYGWDSGIDDPPGSSTYVRTAFYSNDSETYMVEESW